jgi:hypothetical protein
MTYSEKNTENLKIIKNKLNMQHTTPHFIFKDDKSLTKKTQFLAAYGTTLACVISKIGGMTVRKGVSARESGVLLRFVAEPTWYMWRMIGLNTVPLNELEIILADHSHPKMILLSNEEVPKIIKVTIFIFNT